MIKFKIKAKKPSPIKLKRWTPAAVQCYQRGCVCKGCFYEEFFTADKCRMKSSVMELVRQLGAPGANK